jgi:hypothetical protein
MWRAVQTALRALACEERRLFVALDDVVKGGLGPWVDRLLALDTSTRVVSLAMACEPRRGFEFNETCASSRMAAVLRLQSLTRAEAVAFLEQRRARRQLDLPFTHKAATRLHALGRGVPGAMTRLAEAAQNLATEAGRPEVGVEVLERLESHLSAA